MMNCKYDKSIMCSVDDIITKICKGCENYCPDDSEALFTYDIKKAVSDYIISTGKSEREALLMLNEIMKDLIDDYIERGGKNDR